MPLFSVIIPTRNRAALVKNAVASVLEQDFGGFELIISDNSDADRAIETRQSLAHALSDPRVRYIRPDKTLSMVDHWEWAVRQATGDFTGVLTDRMALKLYALGVVKAALEKTNLDLTSYRFDVLRGDQPPYRLHLRRHGGEGSIMRSIDALSRCARAKHSMNFPRMLNSFCRTSRLHELIQQYGSIFTGLAPDISFCFRILGHLECFVMLDDRLLLDTHPSVSNGRALATGKLDNEFGREFLNLYDNSDQWIAHSPIPKIGLYSSNSIFIEYEVARAQHKKTGRFQPLDRACLHRALYKDLQKIKFWGNNVGIQLEILENYRKENGIAPTLLWRSHVGWAYNKYIRDNVFRQIRKLRPVAEPILRVVFDRLPQTLVKNRSRFRSFPSVIEALRFEARHPYSSTPKAPSSGASVKPMSGVGTDFTA